MRISAYDSWETIHDQLGMRYNRTYTVNQRGLPIMIRSVELHPERDEDGEFIEEGEPHIVFDVRTRNNNHRELSEDDIVWNVWPRHHVLFHHKWGGCVVWEKRPDRQIKKLPCESSMRIVSGHYKEHPFLTGSGWYDIVEAMRTTRYHDVETAMLIIKDDDLLSFPISPNAYITSEGQVYYHNMPLGSLAEAREHRLWKIIQKEAV